MCLGFSCFGCLGSVLFYASALFYLILGCVLALLEIALRQPSNSLCPLVSLPMPFSVAPRCHLSNDGWICQAILCPLCSGCLVVACLTSQQQASVSQRRSCSDNCTSCHTETEVADQTFYLTQSLRTDTGAPSHSADPTTLGARQGSHWSAGCQPLVWPDLEKGFTTKVGIELRPAAVEADAFATRPTRWFMFRYTNCVIWTSHWIGNVADRDCQCVKRIYAHLENMYTHGFWMGNLL